MKKNSMHLRFFFTAIVCLSCLGGLHASEADTIKPLPLDTVKKGRAKNSFFIEFGGNAGGYYLQEIFTLNYDRILYNGRYIKTSFRIGTNVPRITKTGGGIRSTHNIPIVFNCLFGERRLFMELGVGFLLHYVNSDYGGAYGGFTGVLGLRYQDLKNGIMARAGIAPTIGMEPGGIFIGPWFAISAGYSF